MEIPKHFKEELERRLEEEIKAKEKADLIRKASEEENRRLASEEDSRLETKLAICGKIFGWKDEFLKTDEGFSLLSKHSRIQIYGGGWGHLLKTDDSLTCWSRVYINGDAVEYMNGYKWHPSRRERFIEPREMAAALNCDYLSRLLDTLENGKVFDYILKNNK